MKYDGAFRGLAEELKDFNATEIIWTRTLKDDNSRARHAKKRMKQKLSLENGRVMELTKIKHDGALRNVVGNQRSSEAPERLGTALTQHHMGFY